MTFMGNEGHDHHDDRLSESICSLACAVREFIEQKKTEFEWLKSHHGLATLDDLKQMEKRIMASQAEIDAALSKIDAATNKLAANVQVIADTDQKISDEIDAFIARVPVGSVLTDAQVAQLQALSDKAQATSDASDAQVAVLQAIAAKGAANPVPVPVPTPPVV
jgi:hypothetical protein